MVAAVLLFVCRIAPALHYREAVIPAFFYEVQFIVTHAAVLGTVQMAVAGHDQALGIPVSITPDRAAGERVVGRNAAIDVDSQDLSVGQAEVLRQSRVEGVTQ